MGAELEKFLDEMLKEYEKLLGIERKVEKIPSSIQEKLKKYHKIFVQPEKITLEDIYGNLYELTQDSLLLHHFPEIVESAKEILRSIRNLKEEQIIKDLEVYLTPNARKVNEQLDNIYLALKELVKRIEHYLFV